MQFPNPFAPPPSLHLHSAGARVRALAARGPHFLWALAILAIFAAFVPFVADDYGAGPDDSDQRRTTLANLRYIMGDAAALRSDHNRYYGVAFETPLLLAERALGLTDSRDIYLLRRVLTHLFFLCGAFACYLLAYRLFGSVPLALIAMLLFLLHPRLYAHSIFNTKDAPFLAMFMIALWLAHWAFSKNSVWAFALLGVAVALATNVRIMGAILVPAALGLRLLDLFPADGWRGPNGRGRVMASAAAFAAAAACAYFISAPYLWRDPLSFIDAAKSLSSHPTVVGEFYRGRFIPSDALPWHYIPTWIWITTPPITLLFAALGAAVAVRRAAANPQDALRNTDLRFALALIALFALPIVGVAALGANMYNGWRHMHFLYAPLALLAAYALHWLPREFKPGTLRRSFARWGALALMCAGLAASLAAIIQLHPNQHDYFNFFVDRETPEGLRKRYTMDYWRIAKIQGLRRLLELHPSGPIFVHPNIPTLTSSYILPPHQRRRIILDADGDMSNNYHIVSSYEGLDNPIYSEMDEVHSVKIYNSSALAVYGGNGGAASEEDIARFMEEYAALTAAEPDARARYDIHLNLDGPEKTAAFVKSPCSADDLAHRFLLRIVPVSVNDLPERHRPRGCESADFWHQRAREAVQTGICLNIVSLPDYPIAELRASQFRADTRAEIWTAAIDLAAAKN